MIAGAEDFVRRCRFMASDLSAEAPVTEFAGQLLFRLWRASHVRVAEELASLELTPALFAILNVVGAREGIIQQELGATLGIDRSTMVSLVDRLEGTGLAERRPSPTDRRAREIAITAKGRRLLQRARGRILETEDEIFAGLGTGEREDLVRLLRRALGSVPPQPPWTAAEGG